MKKYTTEEVNGLLDELLNIKPNDVEVYTIISKTKLERFKKDKGLLPTLEVGKWYKARNGTIFFLKEFSNTDKSFTVYGFDYEGEWMDSLMGFIGIDIDSVEATNQEVETALIAEAKKRGFKEGVKVKCAYKGSVVTLKYDTPSFYIYSNGDTHLHQSATFGKSCFYFCNGKWATIIEDKKEMTFDQIQKELGYEIKIVK